MTKHRKWTDEETALLGTIPDRQIAMRLGVLPNTVSVRRKRLGIPACEIRGTWLKEDLALLGTISDAEVARRTNRSIKTVQGTRYRLGIPPFGAKRAAKRPIYLAWDCARVMPAPDLYRALAEHYRFVMKSNLTHKKLAEMSHYSESRINKWFTAGSGQEPIATTTRHHFWLLGLSWGGRVWAG